MPFYDYYCPECGKEEKEVYSASMRNRVIPTCSSCKRTMETKISGGGFILKDGGVGWAGKDLKGDF